MKRFVRLSIAAIVSILLLTPVVAQEAPSRFQPLDSLPQNELNPGPLVYGAYAFVWAAVLIYVFMLWRRIGRVERELADLKSRK